MGGRPNLILKGQLRLNILEPALPVFHLLTTGFGRPWAFHPPLAHGPKTKRALGCYNMDGANLGRFPIDGFTAIGHRVLAELGTWAAEEPPTVCPFG